jgi:hypothetical protein
MLFFLVYFSHLDDDHTKKTQRRRHLDFFRAESKAGIGDKENDYHQTTSTLFSKDDAVRIIRRLEQVSYIRVILFKKYAYFNIFCFYFMKFYCLILFRKRSFRIRSSYIANEVSADEENVI